MFLASIASLVAFPVATPDISDLWANRAKFVVDERSLGGQFGIHFISATWFNGYLYTYYIDKNAGVSLARTQDGVNFANVGNVVRPGSGNSWDSAFATFPGYFQLTQNRHAIVYEGKGTDSKGWPGDIGLAVGSTLQDFVKDAKPILVHAKRLPSDGNLDLSWERMNVGTPSLFVDNGVRYLFYHGYGSSWERNSPNDVQLGLAIGTDLRNMKRLATGPVLRTGPAGSWDAGQVGKRSIMKGKDGYWYMVYEGSTDAQKNGRYDTFDWAIYSSGIARSRDLKSWTKYGSNPVLPKTNPLWGNNNRKGYGYDGPEFVKFPSGVTYVYFRAPSGGMKRAELKWR